MAIVLEEHFDSTIHHDLDDVNRVTIRRKHIWRDAIRAMSRPTFDPCNCVQVTFIGEEAVDGGGWAQVCFFVLALQELAEDSSIFQGPPHGRFFLHNVQALASRKYFYAGMLVAVSLANGGPGLPCLATGEPGASEVYCIRICTYRLIQLIHPMATLHIA